MALHRRAGLILQHGDDGPPAILGDWLDWRGIEHEVHATWREPLPATRRSTGGSRSLGSEHTPGADGAPAWVDAEIEFLRRASTPTCRCSASASAARRWPSPPAARSARSEPAEIGWLEVETERPRADPAGALAALPLRPARAAARRRGDRPVAGGPGGVRARPLARAPVPPRVDARRSPPSGLGWTPRSSSGSGSSGSPRQRDVAAEAALAARRLFDAWWDADLTAAAATEWVHYPQIGEADAEQPSDEEET